jgi:hypothetical protein
MAKVAKLPPAGPQVREYFAEVLTRHGDHIRQERSGMAKMVERAGEESGHRIHSRETATRQLGRQSGLYPATRRVWFICSLEPLQVLWLFTHSFQPLTVGKNRLAPWMTSAMAAVTSWYRRWVASCSQLSAL